MYILLLRRGLKQSYVINTIELFTYQDTRDNLAWTIGNGDARGVYPSQDTSGMGRARVKQEEKSDRRYIVK